MHFPEMLWKVMKSHRKNWNRSISTTGSRIMKSTKTDWPQRSSSRLWSFAVVCWPSVLPVFSSENWLQETGKIHKLLNRSWIRPRSINCGSRMLKELCFWSKLTLSDLMKFLFCLLAAVFVLAACETKMVKTTIRKSNSQKYCDDICSGSLFGNALITPLSGNCGCW